MTKPIHTLALAPMLALDAETPASGGTAAVDPNTLQYTIPGVKDANDQPVILAVNLGEIPPAVRLDGLKKYVRDYVQNSVNQAIIRHKAAMAPWNAYTAAVAADALQTAVPKPEGEQPTVDLVTVATEARKRLYEGNVRKVGERKEKTPSDPVGNAITQAVLRDLYDRTRETNKDYKWTDAVKAVGGNGRAYLEARIAEKVAAGGNEAELRKVLDERYVKPAELMYGKRTTKATETSLL